MPNAGDAASGSWILDAGKINAPNGSARERTDRTRPRLVFFYSKVSGRCRRVEGFLAQVLQRGHNHDAFIVHCVDIAERPDLAQRFRIDEVPTLVVIADRRVQARRALPRGCSDIEEMLRPWLCRNRVGASATG